MAEPKRGSVKAFKAAEERRKARVASKGKFKIFGKAGSFDSPKKAEAKRKFNEKVAAANKKRINQDSVKKFKQAEERRQVRLAKVNAVRPGSPKGKRIAAKRAEADVEKDLPKSKIPTATTVGTAVGTAANQAKKVPNTTKTLPRAKPDLKGAASSFGEAFKKARAQGVGTKFAYNDKMYSAVTRDDISRAGKSSLQDFLNSAKRKDTKIAKAPGQIIKKRYGGRISVKQEDIKKARKKVSDEAEQRNIELKNRNKGGSISKSRRMSQQGERRKGVMGIGILGGTYKRPSVENAKTKMRALKDSFEDKTHPMKKERIMDAMKSKFAERRERKPSSKVFASGGMISDERKKRIAEVMKKIKERSEKIRNRNLVTPMPRDPSEKPKVRRLPFRPDEAPKFERPIGRPDRKIPAREYRGSMSGREMKSLMEQMGRSAVEDRFKTGGSVMARGCKLGRKKPTKMY